VSALQISIHQLGAALARVYFIPRVRFASPSRLSANFATRLQARVVQGPRPHPSTRLQRVAGSRIVLASGPLLTGGTGTPLRVS
jgi:hypothetical protein